MAFNPLKYRSRLSYYINVSSAAFVLIILLICVSSCTSSRRVSDNRNSNADLVVKGAAEEDRETLTRVNVVAYGLEMIGVKYKYAGRSPKGFDCSGFTHYCNRRFGIDASTSSKAQAKQGDKIPLKLVQPGDLIFFSHNGGKTIGHVALVVQNSDEGIIVVHSTSSRGVRKDNISKSTYWKPRIMYARDIITDQVK